jgi:hypothetical protein
MKKQPLPEEMGTYFLAAMSCPARRARPLAPAMPQATASSPTMHRAAAIRGAVPLNTQSFHSRQGVQAPGMMRSLALFW